ncbi:MAG: hypothetical protein NVSMB51_06200 [Solirubrobacteraceae bacterium]
MTDPAARELRRRETEAGGIGNPGESKTGCAGHASYVTPVERADVACDCWGSRCAARLYEPAASRPGPCIVMAHGFAGIKEAALAG